MDKGGLKNEFSARAKRPEHLERLLGSLEQRDIETLPLTERSKLVQHLTGAVFNEAAKGRFWHIDPATHMTRLYEPPFEREIGQIVRLLRSFEISEYTKNWAVARARELAGELEKTLPYRAMREKWHDMPLEDKKRVLEQIVVLQCKIFSKGGIDFLPSPIVFQTRYGVLGYIKPDLKEVNTLTTPSLNLHEHAIKHGSYETAAYTVVHEQLHSMFVQLAIAANVKQMPSTHPMAQDAGKFLARITYFGFGLGSIKSAYDADPEEKITHAAHRAFNEAYAPRTLFERIREKAAGLMTLMPGR